MFCAKCGVQLEDQAKTCPECGVDVVPQDDIGRLMPVTDYVPPIAEAAPARLRTADSRNWGVVSVVLGAVSLVGCAVLGPFAIWTGIKALRQEPHGRTLAIIGIILGSIPTAMLLLMLASIFIGWMVP